MHQVVVENDEMPSDHFSYEELSWDLSLVPLDSY